MLIFKKKFLDKNRQRHTNLEADDIKIKFYFTVWILEFGSIKSKTTVLVRSQNSSHPNGTLFNLSVYRINKHVIELDD